MNQQTGNALFLILIAVALFAALSYAITQSGRGGGSIDKETAQLLSTRLLQFTSSIQTGIQRMLIRGVPLNQIDVRTPLRLRDDGSYDAIENSNCVSNDCRIFENDGGGVTYIDFEDIAVRTSSWQPSWTKAGHSIMQLIAIEGIGGPYPEILLRVFGVPEETCKLINKKEGLVEQPAYDVTGETFYGSMHGDTTAAYTSTDGYTWGDDIADLYGAHIFCLYNSSEGWSYNAVVKEN